MVALTGIEHASSQFSSVQFGLSVCKYVRLVRRRSRQHATNGWRGTAVAPTGLFWWRPLSGTERPFCYSFFELRPSAPGLYNLQVSAPPLLQTTTATVGTDMQSKQFNELPSLGRNFTALILAAPAIAPVLLLLADPACSFAQTNAAPSNVQRVASLVQRAKAAQQSGRIDEAIRAYREILELRPRWGPVEMNLGLMLDVQKNYPEAVQRCPAA